MIIVNPVIFINLYRSNNLINVFQQFDVVAKSQLKKVSKMFQSYLRKMEASKKKEVIFYQVKICNINS